MLGFIARHAVRAALRPVVHAAVGAAVTNHKAHQEALAWQRHQHAMQCPWWLLPNAAGDSGLYFDRRTNFSQSLPGWPRMVAATGAPGEPPCDQLIALQELPISVRYRLTSVAPGHSAAANARAIAEGHVVQTTGAPQPIADTADYQRRHWCVEGAVSASYRLPGTDSWGADTEELLVLVRQGSSMQVTTRYPGASLDWLRLALFRSVSLPGLIWDASAPAVAREVWPPSTFLAPGVGGSSSRSGSRCCPSSCRSSRCRPPSARPCPRSSARSSRARSLPGRRCRRTPSRAPGRR